VGVISFEEQCESLEPRFIKVTVTRSDGMDSDDGLIAEWDELERDIDAHAAPVRDAIGRVPIYTQTPVSMCGTV
jgi:hypothetical protein